MKINVATMKKNKMNLLLEKICRKAFAVEDGGAPTNNPPVDGGASNTTTPSPTTVQPPVVNTAPISYEQLIAQARAEEKNKLYPEIERLKAESNSKTVKVNDLMLALGTKENEIADLKKQLEKAQSGQANNEELVKAQNTIADLTAQLEAEKNKVNQIELDYYKKAKLQEAEGKIIPDLVHGTTKEEIDASIEASKTRYAEIIASATKQPQPTPQPRADFNQALVGGGVINPSMTPFSGNGMSVEDISSIDVRTPEGRRKYEELRKQMNIR